MPVERSLQIFEQARLNLSGLAKHARLCMSHCTGKVEVLAKVGSQMVFRYHRAADPANRGRVMVFKSDPNASWLDDYLDAAREEFDMEEAMNGVKLALTSPASQLQPCSAA